MGNTRHVKRSTDQSVSVYAYVRCGKNNFEQIHVYEIEIRPRILYMTLKMILLSLSGASSSDFKLSICHPCIWSRKEMNVRLDKTSFSYRITLKSDYIDILSIAFMVIETPEISLCMVHARIPLMMLISQSR